MTGIVNVNDGILMTVYFLLSMKYILNAHGEINIWQMITFLIVVLVISGDMFIVSTLCWHTFVARFAHKFICHISVLIFLHWFKFLHFVDCSAYSVFLKMHFNWSSGFVLFEAVVTCEVFNGLLFSSSLKVSDFFWIFWQFFPFFWLLNGLCSFLYFLPENIDKL